ncbi:GNAT family N-acetyltransferase [Saccharopolyspora sp. 5N102]|uniref:GNAT family N-acetyltransferase n=1 Tax=Saccharopolyspora sp. 5N102 TaxID=3375155 RepID=UPI00378FE7B7
MQVRAAVQDDERTLARIAHAAWSWESAANPQPSLETPFFNDAILPGNVLAAVEGGQVLGFAKLVPMSLAQPKIASATTHVQQVYGFSVAPEHQGRGVGSALLHAVRQEAVARNARRITLRVLSTNTRAQALYLRHGYKVEGSLEGEFFLQGKYVDDVLMALDLSAEV